MASRHLEHFPRSVFHVPLVPTGKDGIQWQLVQITFLIHGGGSLQSICEPGE